MIRSHALTIVFAVLLVGCGGNVSPAESQTNQASPDAAPKGADAPEPVPDVARVRLETDAGLIVVELNGRRAPITTGNFLAYVDQGRFDGTSFYRASRTRGASGRGFIQGGIQRNYRLMLPPIAHEPTSRTGLRHEAGTISMARTAPGTAMGEFFITASDMPSMDADPDREGDKEGFAAFGRVAEGMDVVRRILSAETAADAGRGAMRGQMLVEPVTIVRARRVDDREGRGGS